MCDRVVSYHRLVFNVFTAPGRAKSGIPQK